MSAFNADTAPDSSDQEAMLLRKIAKVLNDTFGVGGTGIEVPAPPAPEGSATEAKQPAFSTAGTPSADVLTVQGAPTGAALPVVLATSPSTTAQTIGQGLKTIASAGTPEALGSGLVSSVAIRPKKTRTTANTGNVWIQNDDTNDLEGGWELTPTSPTFCITAPEGKKIDLAAIFIDVATDGDGVVFFAIA